MRLFSSFRYFGACREAVEEKIRVFEPDMIGISANFSSYLDQALAVATWAKDVCPDARIVFGGRAATEMPEKVMENKNIDYLIRGEAEWSLVSLCNALRAHRKPRNILGLCFRSGGRILVSEEIAYLPDLNAVPWPDRRFIDYRKYQWRGLVRTSLVASRGCVRRCTFCGIKEPMRARTLEHVLAEVRECFRLGIRHFNFEDDALNLHPQFPELIRALGKEFSRIQISCMNGLLPYRLSLPVCRSFLRAGLTHVDFSLVSSRVRVRRAVERQCHRKSEQEAIGFFAKKKVPVTSHFIIGLPGQEYKDGLTDIKFLSRQQVLLGPSIFYPVVGSSIFQELEKKRICSKNDYIFFRSSAVFLAGKLSREQIFSLFVCARVVNFVKELLDAQRLTERGFYRLIMQVQHELCFEHHKYFSREKIPRAKFGIWILGRMLLERVFYRVEETQCQKGFFYRIEKEKFITSNFLKEFTSRCMIVSLSGRRIRFQRCCIEQWRDLENML